MSESAVQESCGPPARPRAVWAHAWLSSCSRSTTRASKRRFPLSAHQGPSTPREGPPPQLIGGQARHARDQECRSHRLDHKGLCVQPGSGPCTRQWVHVGVPLPLRAAMPSAL